MPLTSKHSLAAFKGGFILMSVALAVFFGASASALAAGSADEATDSSSQQAAQTFAAGSALAMKKNCMACHQIDSRRVGPPLASVAARYGSASGLTEYLAQTIRQGGRGRWGAVPMPAQPQVSQEDAIQLAQWILSLPVAPQP